MFMLRIAFTLLFSVVAVGAWAQEYPVRAVKIIVPFAAGGPADVYARFIAQRLQEAMGQPFVVEDRPGGDAPHADMEHPDFIGVSSPSRRPRRAMRARA